MTEENKLPNDLPNGTIHGGQGALKRIRQGKEFVGLAKIAQDEVMDRLEVDGPYGLMLRNAVRLQTACDLYWPVYVKMIEEGEHAKATEYLAKFGWLSSKANLAWQAADKFKPKDSDPEYTEVLARYRTPAKEAAEAKNAPNL